MRIAAMRPIDSEFRVAEREDGGTAQAASKQPLGNQRSQAQPSSHDLFDAPAHLIQAAGTTKPPAHTPKPQAAAVVKHVPSAPQQDHRQTHPEDTDYCAHPTLEEETAHQQLFENRQRDNSVGHHAIAVPAHRPHKPRHNHLANDETDKHDHFRHQPHGQTCYNDYHVELTLKERRQNINISTPKMNLSALFLESTASRSNAPALVPKSRRHGAETPEMNLGFLFLDIDPASNQ